MRWIALILIPLPVLAITPGTVSYVSRMMAERVSGGVVGSSEGLWFWHDYTSTNLADYNSTGAADLSTNSFDADLISGTTAQTAWDSGLFSAWTNDLGAGYNNGLLYVATNSAHWNNVSFFNSTNITLSMWIYPLNLSLTTVERLFSSYKGSGANSVGDVVFALNDTFAANAPRLYVYAGGSLHQIYSHQSITTGEWHHIAGTYDGTDLKIYQAGVLATSLTVSAGSMNTNANQMGILEDNPKGSSAEATPGWYDNIRIYERALRSDEITTLYNEGHDAIP